MVISKRKLRVINIRTRHEFNEILLPGSQYIDDLEVIGTNQPRRSSKFDMMSVVQEEEEMDMLNESGFGR